MIVLILSRTKDNATTQLFFLNLKYDCYTKEKKINEEKN